MKYMRKTDFINKKQQENRCMPYTNTTIQELQKLGSNGDERALIELGSRVLNFDQIFYSTQAPLL